MTQYLIQKYRDEQKQQIFEIYVTDALKTMCENIAHFAGGNVINKRYFDFIDDSPKAPERTSEDIINSISAMLEILGEEENDEHI